MQPATTVTQHAERPGPILCSDAATASAIQRANGAVDDEHHPMGVDSERMNKKQESVYLVFPRVPVRCRIFQGRRRENSANCQSRGCHQCSHGKVSGKPPRSRCPQWAGESAGILACLTPCLVEPWIERDACAPFTVVHGLRVLLPSHQGPMVEWVFTLRDVLHRMVDPCSGCYGTPEGSAIDLTLDGNGNG